MKRPKIQHFSALLILMVVSLTGCNQLPSNPMEVWNGNSGSNGSLSMPTSTLAIEAANNTSTSNSFNGTENGIANGNIIGSNVSKVSIRTLLYPGAQSKIWAHLMAWWGPGSGHPDIGYHSDDAAQVHLQVQDMLSRGIQGAIVDWYGPAVNPINAAVMALKSESEKSAGQFEFGVMEDGGEIASCMPGCDPTQTLITHLNYAYSNFEQSSAYLKIMGRPVVFFFNPDGIVAAKGGTINWATVRAGVQGNPYFIFQGESGFSHSESAGAYSWVDHGIVAPNFLTSLFDSFYSVAQTHVSEFSVGSVMKGFNGAAAPWKQDTSEGGPSPAQACGQVWLHTFDSINRVYSTTHPLDAIQLVTWNDYEEGTALEMGIDNCVAVTAQLMGTQVSWSITGDGATVDHYEVFSSSDGTNLTLLATTHALVYDASGKASGTQIWVKAVGKPSMTNHLSNAVRLL